ncbi:unnamed protein product, partial [Amoebophrya sp. A25]|eukprot:GSA25T00018838001.1
MSRAGLPSPGSWGDAALVLEQDGPGRDGVKINPFSLLLEDELQEAGRSSSARRPLAAGPSGGSSGAARRGTAIADRESAIPKSSKMRRRATTSSSGFLPSNTPPLPSRGAAAKGLNESSVSTLTPDEEQGQTSRRTSCSLGTLPSSRRNSCQPVEHYSIADNSDEDDNAARRSSTEGTKDDFYHGGGHIRHDRARHTTTTTEHGTYIHKPGGTIVSQGSRRNSSATVWARGGSQPATASSTAPDTAEPSRRRGS